MADQETTPVDLSGAIAAAVNGAFMNRTPVTVAYVDANGQPHLSLRGTTQVINDQQLALWARNPEGGLPGALAAQPRLALMYRDPATRTSYQFHGPGRLVTDAALRDRIFDNSPELERGMDPDRRGAAIVIDVTRVEGRDERGVFVMQRAESL